MKRIRTSARETWGTDETRLLLEVWGTKYCNIRGTLNATKKKIWNKIHFEFVSACRSQNAGSAEKTIGQLKKRVSNLEYEYRAIRKNMTSTSEDGTKKLKGEFF